MLTWKALERAFRYEVWLLVALASFVFHMETHHWIRDKRPRREAVILKKTIVYSCVGWGEVSHVEDTGKSRMSVSRQHFVGCPCLHQLWVPAAEKQTSTDCFPLVETHT